MIRGRNFKPEYRTAPLRSRTPSPPREFIEPLSPVVAPAGLSLSFAPNDRKAQEHSNGINGAPDTPNSFPHVQLHHKSHASPTATVDPPLRSAPLPLPRSSAQFSPVAGSPIDTLANAAVSLNASPVFAEPARRSSHNLLSPTAHAPFYHSNNNHTDHHNGDDPTYSYDERPSKRARSEFLPSPQHPRYASRPATSHVPSHGWSYNVEQMVDNGVRLYQDNPRSSNHQEDSSSKRLSDAQLLLDFSMGSMTSYPPQSQVSTARRWSTSYHNLSDPHMTRSIESAKPQLDAPYQETRMAEGHFGTTNYSYTVSIEKLSNGLSDQAPTASAVQTHTPPEDNYQGNISSRIPDVGNPVDEKRPKKHQGWPKGKPRGPRTGGSGTKKKKSTSKVKSAVSSTNSSIPDQLHSPQSLPADTTEGASQPDPHRVSEYGQMSREPSSRTRRHSISESAVPSNVSEAISSFLPRAQSVPPDNNMSIPFPTDDPNQAIRNGTGATAEEIVCTGCHSTSSQILIGDGEQWINCDGCKGWFHFACAGFKSEREVRDVDKFFCKGCSPKFGQTTKVRKSGRAHSTIDYAGLNEGIVITNDNNPEHHYIAAIKNGDIGFTSESFARIDPELVSANFFERNGFHEPVVIPANRNPRPVFPGLDDTESPNSKELRMSGDDQELYEYERVLDVGQDKMDMVIPQGLTVRQVSELYGPNERVEVIDVKSQEGEDRRWTMAKWADYYEQEGEKPVRNVISLEVSQSKLGRLIRRPKAVRDLDLQDSVWPEEEKEKRPKVQFYCLMSVADCYTDFHIDFGGSSVYYHIIKGKKTFFFIPPTKQNLKKYEEWCLSPRQSHEFLGQQVKECFRVDLSAGDTMLIPSGWIHAVWTPEDSLVIGGNFLTRIHYGMQLKVAEIEKNTKVALKFRYPFFQKVQWLAVLKYLDEDPLPQSVVDILQTGGQFERKIPIYLETNQWGNNSDFGLETYNARYYPQAELDGFQDLRNYIWRTVLISLGRIEGITQQTKNAVTRSIPKKAGDPLTIARRFAAWTCWKRGNECIPKWALPDEPLPETPSGEKKLSAAQEKRIERDAWYEALRASRDRHPSRAKTTAPPSQVALSNGSAPPAPVSSTPQKPPIEIAKHLTTPKTSQLGPKRIACDACRRRRIKCKHKDELIESTKGTSPPTLSGSSGAFSSALGPPVKRRESEVEFSSLPIISSSIVPDAVMPTNGALSTSEVFVDGQNGKSGRVKACADCRKSKRRCIHDEFGNIDPIKASEAPVPRLGRVPVTKKRRISEDDTGSLIKRQRSPRPNGDGALSGDIPAQEENHVQAISPKAPEICDSINVSLSKNVIHTMANNVVVADDPFIESVPAHDDIVSSIEKHPEMMDSIGTTPPTESFRTPRTPSNPAPNGFKATTPTTDVARSTSPARFRKPSRGSSGHKTSQTPALKNTSTPKSGGSKNRRDSKSSSVKVEQASPTEMDDEASLRLALQLAQQDHGLRRRS